MLQQQKRASIQFESWTWSWLISSKRRSRLMIPVIGQCLVIRHGLHQKHQRGSSLVSRVFILNASRRILSSLDFETTAWNLQVASCKNVAPTEVGHLWNNWIRSADSLTNLLCSWCVRYQLRTFSHWFAAWFAMLSLSLSRSTSNSLWRSSWPTIISMIMMQTPIRVGLMSTKSRVMIVV